nr:uncharacterized protein LOC109154433 [Ipomoea batatas]
MAESSNTPLTMQNLKQLLDGVMTTQEARLQSQWKDQFQTFMASMEAKWKAITEKAKAAQQPEMATTTPLSNRQALFRANPGLPIATDEGSSDGAPMVQKHSSHRCKGRFLLLIGDEDDETVEGDPVVVEDYHTDEEDRWFGRSLRRPVAPELRQYYT